MHAFCTYCSADKSDEPGEIPAIRRYQSPRLSRVYEAAQQLGVGFYILSGEFGLIPPECPIPWYDHLLVTTEVPALVDKLVQQIGQYGITRLVYFTQPLTQDLAIAPYQDAIMTACNRLALPFLVIELGHLVK